MQSRILFVKGNLIMTDAVTGVTAQPVVKAEPKKAEEATSATTNPVETKKPEAAGTIGAAPVKTPPSETLGKKLYIVA